MGLSIMRAVRCEYARSNIYTNFLLQQIRPVVGYFQEAADILSLEPRKARVHMLAERARQRKEEAQELIKEMESADV